MKPPNILPVLSPMTILVAATSTSDAPVGAEVRRGSHDWHQSSCTLKTRDEVGSQEFCATA